MNINGVVLLDRALARHEVWDAPFMRTPAEPFCKRAAWVDLLLLANTTESAFTKRGREVELGRGQVGWSKKGLAFRWGWSHTKVTGFLAWLEQRGMVRVEAVDKLTTVITITNYELYQGALEALGKETAREPQEHGKSTEGVRKDDGESTDHDREGKGEGEGGTKTPRGEGEREGTRTLTGPEETDGAPSVDEVRTWAQMSGVDPDWAEDRHGYLTERHLWVTNGRLVDWRRMLKRWWDGNAVGVQRRMLKRWRDGNQVGVQRNGVAQEKSAPVSEERLRPVMAALSAQAAETAEVHRVRRTEGDDVP